MRGVSNKHCLLTFFIYVAYTCNFRKYEELKNYSNELQSNIGNLLKIRAVSVEMLNTIFYSERKYQDSPSYIDLSIKVLHESNKR